MRRQVLREDSGNGGLCVCGRGWESDDLKQRGADHVWALCPTDERSSGELVRHNVCSRLRQQLAKHQKPTKSPVQPHYRMQQSNAESTSYELTLERTWADGRSPVQRWEEESSWFLHPLHKQPQGSSLQTAADPWQTSKIASSHGKWDRLLGQTSLVTSLSSIDCRQLWDGILKPRPISDPGDSEQDESLTESSKSFDQNLVSPYAEEIVKLRLQGLRLEEERLLESKWREQLEFLEGPAPGWHELRSNRFHSEAHKNTRLLKRGLGPEQQLSCIAQLKRASFRGRRW